MFRQRRVFSFLHKKNAYFIALLAILAAIVTTTAALPGLESSVESELTAAPDAPVPLVGEGVTGFDLVPPKLFIHDGRFCDQDPPPNLTAAPDDEADWEIIKRLPTYGGFVRILFARHEEHEEDECSEYVIRSNVVADEEYVYWTDDSGLVRLSVEANQGDHPEVVHQHIVSASEEELVRLAMGDENVYAAVYGEDGQTTLYAIHKIGQHWKMITTMPGVGRLSYDGLYLYWLTGDTLWKAYPTPGSPDTYDVKSIANNVTAYYAEGWRRCLEECHRYVFIAQGKRVVRYDNTTGTTSAPLYQSDDTEPSTYIFDVVTAQHLFIHEARRPPCPGPDPCFDDYDQLLIRTGRNGGEWELLDLVPNKPLPDFGRLNTALMTDWDFLFWQLEDTIQRLPNNAEALPLTNLTIDNVQVTQGIQDLDNSVALIAGRRTFARVFAEADEEVVNGVTAHLYRLHPETWAVIDGPLLPINAVGSNITVYTAPMIGDPETSFLFELPYEWVKGDLALKLRAEVNPFNVPLEKAEDRADNVFTIPKTFTFKPSPRLDIQFYVLSYTASDGLTYTPDMARDVDQTFSWLRRVYPLANINNSSSTGLQANVQVVDMPGLAERIEKTHPYCLFLDDDFSDDEDGTNMCASHYVNAMLGLWKSAMGSNDIFFGLYHDGGAIPGFPRGSGSFGVASGPAGPGTWGWDDDGRYTDWYTGHELGHALGRGHPVAGSNSCGHSASDPNFPYPQAWIGGPTMQGFDSGDKTFGIPRGVYQSTNWHDMMSYCDRQWISDYTYWGIYDTLQILPRTAVRMTQADQLAVYGTIVPEQGVALLHHVRRTSDPMAVPPRLPGPYSIRLLDAQGTMLGDYPFTPEVVDESAEPLLTFGQIVEFVAGTTSVQITTSAGDVLAEVVVSHNPPVVENVRLVNASPPISGVVTLEWDAADADGDVLAFDILISHDNGTTFRPLQLETRGQRATINSRGLAGGTAVLRVVASDGVLSGRADSVPFTMAFKPPQVKILSPGDGHTVQWGQLVQFIGEATDPQDGLLPETALTWSLNGERMGKGAVITRERLPVGVNEIQLAAINSHGLSSTTTVTVIVHDDLTFAGPTLNVSPLNTGWHISPRTTEEQTATLLVTNIGTGSFEWMVESRAPWLEVRRSSDHLPATITLTADPRGFLDGTSLRTTVIVTADDGDGRNQIVEVPVTLSVGNVWNSQEGDTGGERLFLPVALVPEERP